MHVIEIERAGPSTFTVWYKDKILIPYTRSPEFDACRELLSQGITGKLFTRHKGSNIVSFVLDIRKAAELTILEGAKRPRFAEWDENHYHLRQDGDS